MNPSIRRYLPVVAVVALLLVAVYFGQPDRMTGSAAGAGCAGGQGQFVAENEAGTVTKSAQDQVRAIINFDAAAFEAGEMASLDDLKTTVEELGVDALPALLEELRDTGCMTTNSAELVDLVQILGDQPDFDGQLYGVIADTLLDVATMSLANAGSDEREMSIAEHDGGKGDAPQMQAGLDTAGEPDEPQMQAKDAAEGGRTFDCAVDALDVVQGWAAGRVDTDDVLKKITGEIDELQPGSAAAVELVEMLAELAPSDDEWAAVFENMAIDQEMDKEARGLACDAAVDRDSDLPTMRNDVSLVTSPQAAVCLLEASISFEDDSYASWGLKNDDQSVRIAALGVFAEAGGDDDVNALLMHLFPAPASEPVGFDDSERGATVKAIIRVVAESETPVDELLAGALDISAQAADEVSQVWLNELASSISGWEIPEKSD